MPQWLRRPIDMTQFPELFKRAHPELQGEGVRFVGFKQTQTRWTATYQTSAEAIEYSGNTYTLHHWMDNKEEYLRRMAQARKPQE